MLVARGVDPIHQVGIADSIFIKSQAIHITFDHG
jgi:hypothetical protein